VRNTPIRLESRLHANLFVVAELSARSFVYMLEVPMSRFKLYLTKNCLLSPNVSNASRTKLSGQVVVLYNTDLPVCSVEEKIKSCKIITVLLVRY
jgi:hypothetical protein